MLEDCRVACVNLNCLQLNIHLLGLSCSSNTYSKAENARSTSFHSKPPHSSSCSSSSPPPAPPAPLLLSALPFVLHLTTLSSARTSFARTLTPLLSPSLATISTGTSNLSSRVLVSSEISPSPNSSSSSSSPPSSPSATALSSSST